MIDRSIDRSIDDDDDDDDDDDGTLAGYPENTERQQGPPRYQARWQDTPNTHKDNRDPSDTKHPGKIPLIHTKATGNPQIPSTLARYP